MKQREHINIEHAGQDSFLDVTTNIVGILIVLVMVVGMRAQNPIVQPADAAPTTAELEDAGKSAATIEYDVRRIGQEVEAVQSDIAAKTEARAALATMIAAAEKEVGDKRAQLGAAQQEDFDLKRELNDSRGALDRGEAELKDLESQKPPTVEVRHYPTPISKTVLGHEVHFQLLGGRIAYVPIDDFIDDVRSNLRSSGVDYNTIADRVGVVGPRNGFEFRYTMDIIAERGRGVVGLRAKEFQVVPVGVQQGETVERALSGQSEFRVALASHSPRDTTVTLWTYPDSFPTYLQLKEELHRMGYATAGRPLPTGVLIGGSDRGTKSSAQ